MPRPARTVKPVRRARPRAIRAIAGSLGARFRRLGADRGGAAAMLFAVSLPAVVGFAGLGTEVANWYLTKRAMQGAADSAAAAAATALAAGTTSPAILASEALSVAASHNFANGSNGTTVAVNHPPTSGAYRNDPNAVEVSISRKETTLLSSLFLPQGPIIGARAVGVADRTLGAEACVVALDPKSSEAMTASGTAVELNFPSCSLYVNSISASALYINGKPTIIPRAAYIVGGYYDLHNSLKPVEGTYTGVGPLIDPYKNVTIPAYSGCNENNYKLSGGKHETRNAGASGVYVFCNGIDLTGNSSLTLGPGTYIIDRGQLKIASGSTLTATDPKGTTIILTTSTGSNCATAQINGQANLDIAAPTSGNLAGIAIYKNRNCINRDKADDKVAGGASQNIKGAIYFPEQFIEFAGGSSTGGAICTQLIAWKIKFVGNSGFRSNCAEAGTRKLVRLGSRLAE
jgi:Flp pilus assembly protein TadG